jgi:hypothetical protein
MPDPAPISCRIDLCGAPIESLHEQCNGAPYLTRGTDYSCYLSIGDPLSNYPKTLSSPGFYGGYTPFSDSYLEINPLRVAQLASPGATSKGSDDAPAKVIQLGDQCRCKACPSIVFILG